MIDLRDDGTVALDFEDGKPPVEVSRPKFGAYKRLRAEQARILQEHLAYLTELRAQEEPKVDDAEIVRLATEHSEKAVAAWWDLILTGDATFQRMTTGEIPKTDDWPAWMIYGQGVIGEVVEHWRRVPLARGGKLVSTETPTTPETTTDS